MDAFIRSGFRGDVLSGIPKDIACESFEIVHTWNVVLLHDKYANRENVTVSDGVGSLQESCFIDEVILLKSSHRTWSTVTNVDIFT